MTAGASLREGVDLRVKTCSEEPKAGLRKPRPRKLGVAILDVPAGPLPFVVASLEA